MVNLGFVTVIKETGGYVGGYLVTNSWGRPLEFRLSSAVPVSKIQQLLYGTTLEPYLCSDLIGKKLLEKAGTPVQTVFTDTPAALDLRLHVAIPVCLFQERPIAAGESPALTLRAGENVSCHPRFTSDVETVRLMLDQLGSFDLAEPFQRIREALAEARKLGVANRAA